MAEIFADLLLFTESLQNVNFFGTASFQGVFSGIKKFVEKIIFWY
jgi:hypothetical protein